MQPLNNNYDPSSVTMAKFLKCAADDGGRNFNIFLNSTDSKSLPRRDPRATQMEIKSMIPNFSKTDNVRYTRSESWIFSTMDVNRI